MPFGLPVVQHIASMDFAPVTVFAGDNGTGKSTTIVEALALMTGFNVGGRNLRFAKHATHTALFEHDSQWSQ